MKMPRWEKLGALRFEPTRCPVCGLDEPRRGYRKVIRGHEMRYDFCSGCGCLYANPRATEQTLRNIYESDLFYEGKEESINYFSFIGGEPYLSKTARARLERIEKFASGKRLLEVASAAGFFLNQAKLQGFEASGVEFSRPMAKWASERWGVPVVADSIERVELPERTYDVIASWGVFTILRDPVAVLGKFSRALKPGGVLALNTYDAESLWGRFWKGRWYILVLNTSQIFSDRTLRRKIEEAGFEVVSRRRDTPYASVHYLIFQFLNHLPGSLRNWWYERLSFLNHLIVRVPLPDVYEYICIKRRDVG